MKSLSDELMLGDIFATIGGKPKRVTYDTCISLALSSWQIDAFNKPIELDIPTLELNGFVLIIKVLYAQYLKRITKCGDTYDVIITLDEKGNPCHVHIWKNSDDPLKAERLVSFSNVLYVHQLQNLMRICELGDEANGFKVKGLNDKNLMP